VRQLNASTNLFLTILAGLGLLGSLSMNWFATPVTDPTATDGPVERGAFQVSQFFATHARGQITGTDGLGGSRTVLVALVLVVAVAVLAVSTPSLRRQAEDFLQLVALAAPVVVIAVVIAHQGTGHATVRVHYGFLVGLAATLLMSSAAWQGARMREKRKAPKGAVRISQS
jgi:peptidoglycan/LPS O-acetylase OafA/YrhL